MKVLLQEIQRDPLVWLLVFVPIALAVQKLNHECPFGARDFAAGCSLPGFDMNQ
jgi:hypothetical protein